MSTPRFQELTIKRINTEGGGSVAVTLDIPPALREIYRFEPGQFLTLRATVNGQEVRRSYSISSPRSRLTQKGELEIGIRPVLGGLFSNWAATELKVGDKLSVLPPDGRFTVRKQRAIHRVGFAAGSGITPILSILATTLEEQPESKFTLVLGNRRMSSVMFNEALQNLKDRYLNRLTLIHVLSSQAQETELLEGRVDPAKVRAIIAAFLPVASMDEVFVCGPEAMIESTEKTLLDAGVPASRVYSERFISATPLENPSSAGEKPEINIARQTNVTVVVDGKEHQLQMGGNEVILDVALNAGLDLPFSCRGGVCCTCRAKVMSGTVSMAKNYTLEPWEMEQGFVLSCQARPTSENVVVSFDER